VGATSSSKGFFSFTELLYLKGIRFGVPENSKKYHVYDKDGYDVYQFVYINDPCQHFKKIEMIKNDINRIFKKEIITQSEIEELFLE